VHGPREVDFLRSWAFNSACSFLNPSINTNDAALAA
jgi:hypothetical protein